MNKEASRTFFEKEDSLSRLINKEPMNEARQTEQVQPSTKLLAGPKKWLRNGASGAGLPSHSRRSTPENRLEISRVRRLIDIEKATTTSSGIDFCNSFLKISKKDPAKSIHHRLNKGMRT